MSSFLTAILGNTLLICISKGQFSPFAEMFIRVDPTDLVSGGVGKDQIPPINLPVFDDTSTTTFSEDSRVIGLVYKDEAKAYPHAILNYHEIVTDWIGDLPISVTHCPLCDTSQVFIRKLPTRFNTTEQTYFGTSGLLYQSCLVMYDRKTDSLWSQPWGLGIRGYYTNHILDRLPSVVTTLGAWKAKYPQTKILSKNTGYKRKYDVYPYGNYTTDQSLRFSARELGQKPSHPKKTVSYIYEHSPTSRPHNLFSGKSAYVEHSAMQNSPGKTIKFGKNKTVEAVWSEDFETVMFADKNGTIIPSSTAFSFAYNALFGYK